MDQPIASVFIATSLDGFIARPNGDLDWLPVPDGAGGEDYGYADFMATIDTLVMGRATYEKGLTFDTWPYAKRKVVVLTSRSLPAPPESVDVDTMGGDPRDIVRTLGERGAKGLYIDGGVTIQRFLDAGLIQRVIITTIPILIGEGLPLFGRLSRDIRFEHVDTRHWPNGLVQSEYRVQP